MSGREKQANIRREREIEREKERENERKRSALCIGE